MISSESQEMRDIEVKCSNCSLDVSSSGGVGYVDSYFLPVSGKTITVLEALEAIFRGYESSSTFISSTRDQIKFCVQCGNVFGKLLKLYTQFLELSTLDSYIHELVNGFPHQLVAEPKGKGSSLIPIIVNINSHNIDQLNPDLDPEYEDVKIETEDFSITTDVGNDVRKSRRVKTPTVVQDASYEMGSESGSDDDFLCSASDTSFHSDDQKDSDSDFDDPGSNQGNSEKAPLKKPSRSRSRSNSMVYKCEICEKLFENKFRLTMHKEAEHEGIRNFRCEHCDGCYRSRKSLRKHELMRHQVRIKEMLSTNELQEEDKSLLIYEAYKCNNQGCETVSLPSFKEWVVHQHDFHKRDLGYKDFEKLETLQPKHHLSRPCPQCGKEFKNNSETVKHIKRIHLNLQHFECTVCLKKFATRDTLNRHSKTVHRESMHLCDICGTSFTTKYNMELHKKRHSDGKSYRKSRRRRIKTPTVIPDSSCGMESENPKSNQTNSEETPLKLKKPSKSRSTKTYKCEVCEKLFKNNVRLTVHKEAEPEGIRNFRCEYCDGCYRSGKSLRRHERMRHQLRIKEMLSTNQLLEEDKSLLVYENYKCNHQSCKTVSVSSFKEWVFHQHEFHKRDLEYKEFEKRQTLKPKHHLLRPCPHCGKEFKSNSETVNHIKRIHLNLQTFECTVCLKKFATRNTLNMHSKTVHTESMHLCDICGTSFTTKYNLELHRQIHTNLMSYQCDECGKAFKTERNLYSHKKLHVLRITLPHTCEFCKKRFAVRNKLKRHLMSRHKLCKEVASTSAGRENKTEVLLDGHPDENESNFKPMTFISCELENTSMAQLETTRNLTTNDTSFSTRKRKASALDTGTTHSSTVYDQKDQLQQ